MTEEGDALWLWRVTKLCEKSGKGKAVPLQAWAGPEGSTKLRLPDFKTNRHMTVVRLSALRAGRLYPPGNIPGAHFCKKLNQPQGHSAAGRILSIKSTSDTSGDRTGNFPVCNKSNTYINELPPQIYISIPLIVL
jgi:hypothetical protein